MKKFDLSIFTVAVLLVGLVILGVSQAWQEQSDPALVKAGDTSITQYQLYDEMKNLYGKQMLNELVSQSLITQEAKLQNITVEQQEIDKQVESMKQQSGSEEAFRDYLSNMGMDEKNLREKLRVLMTRDKLLDKAFPVTEEQVKKYYDTNKEQMGSPVPELGKVREQIKQVLADGNRGDNYGRWMENLQKKYQVQWFDPSFAENEPGAKANVQANAKTNAQTK